MKKKIISTAVSLFVLSGPMILPLGALAADSDDAMKTEAPLMDETPQVDTSDPIGNAKDSQFNGDLSNLENKFFYQTFPNDTVDQRLDRIEKLVYGVTKTGSVQDRITRLLLDVPHISDPDLATSNTMPPVAPQQNTYNSMFNNPVQSHSLVSDVSAMEQEVFGKTYFGDSLIDRVKRLEKSVFPNDDQQTFTPITKRINKLMQALQPKFTASSQMPDPKPWVDTNTNGGAGVSGGGSGGSKSDADKKKHPLLHKIGHILGDVGTVAGMAAAGIAAGSMYGGYGYGYGGYGFGYPGFGYGGWGYPGYGFGPRPFMGCW